MIKINQQKTKKVVGETSLFVTFPYRSEFVDICKRCSGSNYDKKEKTWEIPIIYLSEILDSFVEFDDIELNLLPDKI